MKTVMTILYLISPERLCMVVLTDSYTCNNERGKLSDAHADSPWYIL